MKLSPGNRVLWWHDGEATKAVVDRLYKNRVRIKTADFAAVTVGLDEVELVPLVEKKLPPTSLPPTSLPPTNSPGRWIEKKVIHGDVYLYERWREEIEVDGVKRKVKRSRYLEKVTTDS